MPKGIKPPPPQQSSLSEMWGRAKPKNPTSNEGDSKSKVTEEDDEERDLKPKRRTPGMVRDCALVKCYSSRLEQVTKPPLDRPLPSAGESFTPTTKKM